MLSLRLSCLRATAGCLSPAAGCSYPPLLPPAPLLCRRRSGLLGARWPAHCWSCSSQPRRRQRCARFRLVCACSKLCSMQPPVARVCLTFSPQPCPTTPCPSKAGSRLEPPALPASSQPSLIVPCGPVAGGGAARLQAPAQPACLCGDGRGAVHAAQGPLQVCAQPGAVPQGPHGRWVAHKGDEEDKTLRNPRPTAHARNGCKKVSTYLVAQARAGPAAMQQRGVARRPCCACCPSQTAC